MWQTKGLEKQNSECFNYATPLKYSSSQLICLIDTIYKCKYGYFIFREDINYWIFVPFDQDFDANTLIMIADILKNFNKN